MVVSNLRLVFCSGHNLNNTYNVLQLFNEWVEKLGVYIIIRIVRNWHERQHCR